MEAVKIISKPDHLNAPLSICLVSSSDSMFVRLRNKRFIIREYQTAEQSGFECRTFNVEHRMMKSLRPASL
jgi:hypothetical protein